MKTIRNSSSHENKKRGFYEACISGNCDVVQFILKNKEKYQYKIDLEWICLEEKKVYLFTAIEFAARHGHFEIAKLLYQHNATHNNVNILSNDYFYERS